jgi:CheY-like chemotaxis protein
MNTKALTVMLIDDNSDDNFYHERVIKKNNPAHNVISIESAMEAIAYLANEENHQKNHPDLILLDINMPEMNGWEFIEEYEKLDQRFRSKLILIMLTTSDNPDDLARARTLKGLADFKTKPLTKEMLNEIILKYFSNE